jgi:hypothetical protein
MKKLLTLLLVFALMLGLAAPALAFTSDDTDKDKVPYDLSIYLVEYDDNDFFGIASLPQSDRGYAKNEIVAAVVELYVPKNEAVVSQDYMLLSFGGENVDLDITDNYDGPVPKLNTNYTMGPDSHTSLPLWNPFEDNEIIHFIFRLAGEKTYKWLFFAKVTGDDASLYAELKDGILFVDLDLDNLLPQPITLDGIWYSIQKAVNPDGDIQYTIAVTDAKSDYFGYQIWIDTDKNNKSVGMTIFAPPNPPAILGVTTDGKLGAASIVSPAVLNTSGDLYDDVMDFYNDIVVDVFGLDYFKIGNYVRDSYFENLVSPRTLIATVDIEPWTAYVAVPDNIVTDPPKTGDTASIMGFVMVSLSAAGAVALKKRG